MSQVLDLQKLPLASTAMAAAGSCTSSWSSCCNTQQTQA